SSQGSKLHSPTSGQFQAHHDGPNQTGPAKGSKLSSKSASISSKASASPSPAIKSPIGPLPKTTSSSAVVDPTVTELHVNAVKEPTLHSSANSAQFSPHNIQGLDSA